MLLVLEDLHWADTSTLDLVVFLAHNLVDRPVLLLGTSRADELASTERAGRLADGVRRSGSAMVLELGPLEHEELAALLAARTNSAVPAALAKMIAARSEGNPFFAEELLAAATDAGGELPRHLRDLLLRRVTRPRPSDASPTPGGRGRRRDVAYPLLCPVAVLPERDVRESLRRSVEHGVLVADPASGSFRFRHALLAEVIYATILPGEREELHAARRAASACSAAAAPAELASHWAAAGRTADALAASVEAAREAEEAFGLAEALAHLERALRLWDAVPGAAELAGVDLAGLCSWAAELASQAGAAPRAVELARRAIDLIEERDPLGARLYERLGRYLHESGRTDAALSAFERWSSSCRHSHLRPASGGSSRARPRDDARLALRRVARDLRAGARLARAVGSARGRASGTLDLGRDLAYLGRADEGLGHLWRALELAEESGDPLALLYAYVSLTDVLTMLGSPGDSARVGERGSRSSATTESTARSWWPTPSRPWSRPASGTRQTTAARPRSTPSPRTFLTCCSYSAPTLSSGAASSMRRGHTSTPRSRRFARTAGRGSTTSTSPSWPCGSAAGPTPTRPCATAGHGALRQAAQLRVWFCAKGLRAQAELAALGAPAVIPTPSEPGGPGPAHSSRSLDAAAEASAVTPNTGGWLALAEAEYQRARGIAKPEPWMEAAATWDRLERPPLAAYCNWRATEALVAAGAPRTEASVPLGEAHTVATRINAKPLTRELELLAQRARLELPPLDAGPADRTPSPGEILGLTPREVDVPHPRRPRIHESRDRHDARHQRQDGQRPRFAHPAQGGRIEQARGGCDRAPPRPGARRETGLEA